MPRTENIIYINVYIYLNIYIYIIDRSEGLHIYHCLVFCAETENNSSSGFVYGK